MEKQMIIDDHWIGLGENLNQKPWILLDFPMKKKAGPVVFFPWNQRYGTKIYDSNIESHRVLPLRILIYYIISYDIVFENHSKTMNSYE
jgi:hypothetical protein